MTTEQVYTIEEIIRTFKTSRATLYQEIAAGRLVTYKLGRRRYVTPAAAAAWQQRFEAEANEGVRAADKAVA